MINLITGQSWWSPAEGVGARGVALQARHTHLCYHSEQNHSTGHVDRHRFGVIRPMSHCSEICMHDGRTGARVSVNIHKT